MRALYTIFTFLSAISFIEISDEQMDKKTATSSIYKRQADSFHLACTVGCAARTDPGYPPNSVPSRYTAGARSTPYRETPSPTVGCAVRTDPD
ncbi:hypothetical protein D9M68_821620 [compost metagenome]